MSDDYEGLGDDSAAAQDTGEHSDLTQRELDRLSHELVNTAELNDLRAAQRELAAYKHVMDTLRDSPCKYPPWRDAREVVEWIERRVAVRLAANA